MEFAEIATVSDPRRAATLMEPLRCRILAEAREPVSAAEIARRLHVPRQRLGYHVRALAKAGFLRKAGRKRRGNFIEQRYVASARFYVLSPEVLGPLAPGAAPVLDRSGAACPVAGLPTPELGGRAPEPPATSRQSALPASPKC